MPHVAPAAARLGAVVDLNRPGHVVHWGFVQLSLANLLVIVAMLLVFAAAVLLPFPKGRRHDDR